MCGIVGIFRPGEPEAANRAFVQAAISTMRHRGPDGSGSLIEGPVGLGMTRLAIIDIEGSTQPIFNEDKSIALVCNGEIYNYIELREELTLRGHRFQTQGDCETVVHLYEEFGYEGFSRLRGMFAFVLWDRRRQKMVAARDRLGIKPLYWVEKHGVHAFCSAQRAFVSTGLVSPSLAERVVLGYLRHTFSVHVEDSLLAEVRRLPPGSTVEITNQSSTLVRYWREPDPTCGGTLDNVLAQIEESSKIHQRADVQGAVLLSSGIDSSLIASLAARSNQRLQAITAGYRRASTQDESSSAEGFAKSIGLSTRRLLLDDEDLRQALEEMSARVDEPAADPSSAVQWILYREARRLGCRVVHTGIGGDEVFFGYTPWNRVCSLLEADSLLPGGTGIVTRAMHAIAYSHLPALSDDEGLLGIQPANLARARMIASLMESRLPPAQATARRTSWTGLLDGYRCLRRTYLTNNGLLLADKLGMAASVEVRVPLVDHLVLEAMLALPISIARPQRRFAKPVLRAALEQAGGPGWYSRTKRGFEIPPELIVRLVHMHFDEIRASSTAAALFSATRWRAMLDVFLRATHGIDPPGRMRDRMRRYAWIFSLAGRPDVWSITTLLYSLLFLDRCRRYWSSPGESEPSCMA
jgi:asparagine synthase (glutamine-hydrolysing)